MITYVCNEEYFNDNEGDIYSNEMFYSIWGIDTENLAKCEHNVEIGLGKICNICNPSVFQFMHNLD